MIEMSFWRMSAVLVILGLMCTAALGPVPCNAVEVWSDNFNDGNYDGWSMSDYGGGSKWTAVDGVLQVNQSNIGVIYHPSTEVIGTWSFDIETCSNPSAFQASDIAVFFMSSEPTFYESEDPWTGYAFQMTPALTEGEMTHVFSIRKKSAEMSSATRALVLDSYEGDPAGLTWYHIDVTRAANGQMTVFLNDTQILQALDTDFDTSEYLACVGTMHQCFDNFLVDDTPPPPDIPIVPLAIGGAAVVVVVGVVVGFKRR